MNAADREKLRRYMKVPPKVKLAWLEEMAELAFKASTKPLKIHRNIKR